MAISLTVAAIALFLAMIGAIVLFARPHHGTNRTMAAIFALYAGVTFTFGAMRGAAAAGDAEVLARTLVWYALPQPFLLALLARRLYGDRKSIGQSIGVLLVGAATVAAVFIHLLAPARFVAGVVPVRGTNAFSLSSGELYPYFTFLWYALQLVVILASARAASSARCDRPQRQQAALIGLAFAFLILPAGAWYLPLFIAYPNTLSTGFFIRSGTALAVFVATLVALPRLVRAFDGPARRIAIAAVALPLATGLFDGANLVAISRGAPLLAGYDSSVLLWRAGFGAALAVALFRYDLVGAGQVLRARLTSATRWGLVAAVVLGAGGLVLALLGTTTQGLVGAVILGGAALVISPIPLRTVARGLTERIVPEAPIDEAWRHRTRTYTEALQRLRDPITGNFDEAALANLARLRHEMELTERDHALLVEAVGAPTPAQSTPVKLLGRYRIERELARGATGTALLARDPEGRQVVLKRFHAKAHAARAQEEARALATVDHPNVLRLIEADRVGDEMFLVTPYASGGTLADRVEKGPLPPAEATRLVIEGLCALEALHSKGLVHRDIKLANLFLHEGHVWLGDLGAVTSSTGVDVTLTGDGIEGSLATMAPETLRGRAPTPAGDVYAMGAVLYRALTAAHYVDLEGVTAYSARERVLHAQPRLPHALIPEPLAAVLHSALAKKPGDRCSVVQMRASLERIVAQASWNTNMDRPTASK